MNLFDKETNEQHWLFTEKISNSIMTRWISDVE